MSECVICGKPAIYKIRGEKIFYCKDHALEFFDEDCLEQVRKIVAGARSAEVLKKFVMKG